MRVGEGTYIPFFISPVIFDVSPIILDVSPMAGAAAGAAVVSAAGVASGDLLHAAKPTTVRTRARRFMLLPLQFL